MSSLTRRTALALGLAAAAGLTVRSRSAVAAEISVGDLLLAVPETVVSISTSTGLGRDWQWQGRTDDSQLRPAGIVLARADLKTSEPVEVLGLLLAPTATGLLPDILLTGRRSHSTPGGLDQTRVGLSYAIGPKHRYEGELLIAPRIDRPSGLVVTLTDGSLPASFRTEVLDSVRWRS